jgi:hypothetical protein
VAMIVYYLDCLPGLIVLLDFSSQKIRQRKNNLRDLCGLERSGRENPKYTTLPA